MSGLIPIVTYVLRTCWPNIGQADNYLLSYIDFSKTGQNNPTKYNSETDTYIHTYIHMYVHVYACAPQLEYVETKKGGGWGGTPNLQLRASMYVCI